MVSVRNCPLIYIGQCVVSQISARRGGSPVTRVSCG